MGAIDAMLRELHALRSRLVGEIRETLGYVLQS